MYTCARAHICQDTVDCTSKMVFIFHSPRRCLHIILKHNRIFFFLEIYFPFFFFLFFFLCCVSLYSSQVNRQRRSRKKDGFLKKANEQDRERERAREKQGKENFNEINCFFHRIGLRISIDSTGQIVERLVGEEIELVGFDWDSQ